MHAFERSDLLLLKFVWLSIDVLVAGRVGCYFRVPFGFADLGCGFIFLGWNFYGGGVVEFTCEKIGIVFFFVCVVFFCWFGKVFSLRLALF